MKQRRMRTVARRTKEKRALGIEDETVNFNASGPLVVNIIEKYSYHEFRFQKNLCSLIEEN